MQAWEIEYKIESLKNELETVTHMSDKDFFNEYKEEERALIISEICAEIEECKTELEIAYNNEEQSYSDYIRERMKMVEYF